ncbi:MAG: nitrate reductase cytochrome c-type subunit [Betaproteobacteria bacterium]|nr:nitrate reductase cytochrome c-type subunit [Betaproteobacteria bacterium]
MKVPTFALILGGCALAATLLLRVELVSAASDATGKDPVKLQSLRSGTPLNKDNPPSASHQERDHKPADRDFVQMPPLIPHTTEGYQVTKNFNKCMDCHAWQKTKTSGATKVSVTHFRNREGQELDNVSPRRYFCTQCHVAQTDAKPLVENTFQRARGMQ